MDNKENKVYILMEDDDRCDLSLRVFKNCANAEAAFTKILREYFDSRGYHPTYVDENLHTFTDSVAAGVFAEDGYYLSIQEKELE